MERKVLIKRLGEYFGVKPKYLGTPSFAYEFVTKDEVYTVLKDGQILSSTGEVISFDELTTSEIEEINNQEDSGEIIDGLEIYFPLNGHSSRTLLNLTNMLASKQGLIIKALGLNTKLVEEEFVEKLNERSYDSIDDFRKAFEPQCNDCCQGLTINFDAELISLNIKSNNLDDKRIQAFADLAVFLNKSAKMFSRTSPNPAQENNPKYAFRTWLIRLGMNGEQFKETRRILLDNLDGNSAFRTVDKVGDING